ncbi:MAG: hypothetical protein FWF78_01105 [Defluviitaleaceae bacterium]|nr:hypothetical protein [Defluviitaleaceae bacterium]
MINTSYNPLTAQEIKFAKAFKIHQQAREKIQQLKASVGAETAEDILSKANECEETKGALDEIIALRRDNHDLFTHEFSYAMFGIKVMGSLQWQAELLEAIARGTNSARNFPQGDFNFDEQTNAITLGMGSKIPMGHYNLHIFDDIMGAFENHVRNPQDRTQIEGRVPSVYLTALSWLLFASQTRNSSLGTNIAYSDDKQLNSNVISLLQKMGVDTSRDFSINGTTFEIRNGKVQTQGYTPRGNLNASFIGEEGMREIMARAYAQNLFNPTND